MRRHLLGFYLAISTLFLAVCASAVPILDETKISDRTLDNGFRVIVKDEDQWGLAAASLYVRVGSADEGENEVGAAHLLEHVIFEATDPRDNQRVGPAIEAMGGYVNAMTTRDFTRLEVTVASQYLDRALELMAETVFEPQITSAAVTRERDVVARELVDRLDGAGGVLDDLIWSTAFEVHPYRRPIGGTPEQVTNLTRDDLLDFYERHYVPGNMALVVVGDVNAEAVYARAEELFGSQPAAPAPERDWPAEPEQTDVRVSSKVRDSGALIVTYAWRAPRVADFDDVCAMDLIYTILGEGQFGRLHRALNEPGLAVMSTCTFLTQRDPGLMMITAMTVKDNEAEVRSTMLEEIERLRDEPLTEEELDEAKRVLRISYAFSNESYTDQAGALGFYEAISTYTDAVEYIERVEAVTPEQLQEVARRYLAPDRHTLAIIRPKQAPGEVEEARVPCESSLSQG